VTASARQSLLYILAGLAAPLLWTLVEAHLINWLPTPSTKLSWRLTQLFVGFASALLLVGPLVYLARPHSIRYGLLFVAAFIAVQVVASDNLVGLFQLPDVWAFLGTSLVLVWLASFHRRGVPAA